MDHKKIDIVAVARAAKVSASTVSRSFNHPDLVKGTTRKKIDAAVRRLGYIRNRAAQTIHGIRSGTVGLIVPTIDHTIFAELIQSFATSIEERGFTILLASHGYSLDREYGMARKMLEHRVDGLAFVGHNHSEDTFELLRRQKTPTILLWNYAEASPFPSVGSDNFLAGRLVGEHVAGLGHRSVALLFPPLAGNDRASERFEGVVSALGAAGCALRDDWQLETPYSVDAAKEAVMRFVSDGHRPTAIICGNDVLAWGALHALAKLRLRVPDDVTVTGIGDFKGSGAFEPGLTTVRIPAHQIGAQAAEMIANTITTDASTPKSVLVPPVLVPRKTSAPK
ncbi:Transcriptional regulator, LacI family [Candidatus Rhodobacter oscarellae]|uniref:Transcriptional regulator, LacI family n=1 Tax=Candidatus Rhodobacter oscarellae TaxID=1675527 RepID=A0A0J9E392_9RHOB|nr:LacI family DNA-binding transcriptional regulator [Candidatus Rhodobacter lobularis]KMW57240.1 Transcriptional regulator, LacI family [Candidatus Rhodobacter lobularis]